MSRMLDPSMDLSRQGDRITLHRRSWPEGYPRFPLHPVCAVILALFDGVRSDDDVVDTLTGVFSFSREAAARTTHATVRKYERFLTDSEQLHGREPVRYDPVNFIVPVRPEPRLLPRETVPQCIWWRVTRYCNRRCKYCCIAARHALHPPDATLSFERLREIFTEGADIGVRGVSLGGGEPFLRTDLVDIIELLLALRYEIQVDTKFALSDEQAGRLAAAGLPEIRISLDSPFAETANDLVGDDTYFDGITGAIRSLLAHGVYVNVATVLTERNAHQLPLFVEFLANLGVKEQTLNTFSRYYGTNRHTPALELSSETIAWLRETVPALEEKHAGSIRFTYDRNFNLPAACTAPRNGGVDVPMRINCDQGIRVLRMLPDGRVSRCDQWWHEEDLVFGDLRQQSIHEVWSSPALLEMISPPRERFRGTACDGCDVFDACTSTGRCFFASHEKFGTFYAPDNHCVRQARS
ncbi:MAG TPA: radical SAM protein [Thermoanaerobaculia bacterium]|nr:radical SAM protein [Thermoanaerobaculia bacterium]